MSTTLTDTITATDTTLNITGSVSGVAIGGLYAVESEFIRVDGFAKLTGAGGDDLGSHDTTVWRVQRGAEGTTAAAHNSGTAITAVVDGFAASSTLTAPSPVVAGSAPSNPLTADLDVGGFSIIGASGTGPITFSGSEMDFESVKFIYRDEGVTHFNLGNASFENSLGASKGVIKEDSGNLSVTGGFGGAGLPGSDIILTAGAGDNFNDAAASITIGGGSGAGVAGLITLVGLPTSDPSVAGALWNSNGTVKISAG